MKPMPADVLKAFRITPDQLAEMFWALDDREQADFFNQLGVLALSTPAPFTREIGGWFPLDWQMHCCAVHAQALPLGRRAMEIIGENSHAQMLQPYEREDVRYRNLPTRGGGA